MAKFCNKCGKALVDGICPDCSKKEEVKEEQTTTSNLGNDLLDIIKNIWKKPIEIIEKYVKKENLPLSFILLGIGVLVGGIFTYCYTDSIVTGIVTQINNKMAGIASMMGQSYTATTPITTIPFFQLFLSGILTTALAYTFFILLSKLFVGIIFKGKASLKQFTTAVATASVFPTLFTLVGILTSFISYQLTSFIYLIGLILFIVVVVQSFMDVLKAKEERLGYAVPLTVIITYIGIIVINIIVLAIITSSQVTPIY